jgi:hypothetical protein
MRARRRAATWVRWRRWLLAAGCGTAAAGVGASAVFRVWPLPPDVNHAQAQAMLPTIEKFLDSPVGGFEGGGLLGADYPKLKSRTFCTATIIDIRRAGPRWRVGMVSFCAEYARRGHTLVTGTASAGDDEVMVLAGIAGRHYRVVSAVGDNWSPVPLPGWVDRHFSPGAAREINSGHWPAPPNPVVQARRAFGFPPGTKAVNV